MASKNVSTSSKPGRRVKYIWELPSPQYLRLCRILDQDDKWHELGALFMDFSQDTLADFRNAVYRRESPAARMLQSWGNGNHTIEELFVLLSRMGHKRGMTILKDFVNPKFHLLLNQCTTQSWVVPTTREPTESSIYSWPPDSSVANGQNKKVPVQDGGPDPSDSSVYHAPASVPKHQSNAKVSEECLPASSKPVQPVENGNLSTIENYYKSKMTPDPHNYNIRESQRDIPPKFSITPSPNRQGPNMSPEPESIEDNDASRRYRQQLVSSPPVKEPVPTKQKNRTPSPSSFVSDSSVPYIAYEEILKVTANFDDKLVLGQGGFGVVYKGVWKNTKVAVKRIVKRHNPGLTSMEEAKLQQSYVELRALTWYRHDNILMLYGFSESENELCLICQYMVNGSLEDRLQQKNGTLPLSWMQRLNIACGSARGIQFLHTCEKELIHGDIKSANILLDANLEPKIGDFGLARKGPESHHTHTVVSSVHGTSQYLPPEYLRSHQLSTKVDTYSFGIVLYELATGALAYDKRRPKGKEHLISYVHDASKDEQLGVIRDKEAGEADDEVFGKLIQLGNQCVKKLKKERPEMVEVLSSLDEFMRVVKSKITISRAPSVGLSALAQPFVDMRIGRCPSPTPSASSNQLELYQQAACLGVPSVSTDIPNCEVKFTKEEMQVPCNTLSALYTSSQIPDLSILHNNNITLETYNLTATGKKLFQDHSETNLNCSS